MDWSYTIRCFWNCRNLMNKKRRKDISLIWKTLWFS